MSLRPSRHNPFDSACSQRWEMTEPTARCELCNPSERSNFADSRQAMNDMLADAKEALTEQEWTTLMDQLQRYTANELGEQLPNDCYEAVDLG